MSYQIRYTTAAREDLQRLFDFLVKYDTQVARRALEAISKATELLELFPFTCRKVEPNNSFLRELILSFGASGYVALFEIEAANTVTILAFRHQLEDDYH